MFVSSSKRRPSGAVAVLGYAAPRLQRLGYMRKTAQEHLYEALAEEIDHGPYRLVMLHGSDFEPELRPAGIEPMPKRYCFRNAFRLASEKPGLSYVEGFALARGWKRFQAPHAWCVDRAGRVVDPTSTWAESAESLPGALRGIEIPLQAVRPVVEIAEPSTGVLDAYRDRIDALAAILGLPSSN